MYVFTLCWSFVCVRNPRGLWCVDNVSKENIFEKVLFAALLVKFYMNNAASLTLFVGAHVQTASTWRYFRYTQQHKCSSVLSCESVCKQYLYSLLSVHM